MVRGTRGGAGAARWPSVQAIGGSETGSRTGVDERESIPVGTTGTHWQRSLLRRPGVQRTADSAHDAAKAVFEDSLDSGRRVHADSGRHGCEVLREL